MIRGIIKRISRMFHVPGEEISLLAFDDRCKSIRIYHLWSKLANKFENKVESKVIEGNVSDPKIFYREKTISEPSAIDGILERIGHSKIPGAKTVDKLIPQSIREAAEPAITHTTGVITNNDGSVSEELTFKINRKYGHIFKTDDLPAGILYMVDMQTGEGGQLIPKQVRVTRDPILDVLWSINPFFWGSTIDSFIATELLRGRVELWKTILFCAVTGIICLFLGMGM